LSTRIFISVLPKIVSLDGSNETILGIWQFKKVNDKGICTQVPPSIQGVFTLKVPSLEDLTLRDRLLIPNPTVHLSFDERRLEPIACEGSDIIVDRLDSTDLLYSIMFLWRYSLKEFDSKLGCDRMLIGPEARSA
jgi:hypothetical protein